MWVVEIKSGSARRTTSVLIHSVISSAPKTKILEHTLQILLFATYHGKGPVLNVKSLFKIIKNHLKNLNIISKVTLYAILK